MMSATPPPRQQVLYGIRIQAEQARNLVEDLEAGSDSAAEDLLNLASQILARARMYKWPRLTIWASALEERLARALDSSVVTTEDLGWFEKHIERLDSVIAFPSGADGESAEPASSQVPADVETPVPEPPDGGGGEGDVEIDEEGAFDLGDELGDLDLDIPMTPRPGSVEIALDELEVDWDAEEGEAPLDADAAPAPEPAEGATSSEPEEALEAERSAASIEDARSQPTPVPAADEPAEADEAPERSSRPTPAEGVAADAEREERPSQADAEGRATLGRLEIQRRRKTSTLTSTEIQGPNQYIVVSVAEDPEVHLWLGRALPERKFELLTAKGAADAELLCREHQPDLLLVAWDSESDLAQQTLARIRENPLTRYVRVSLVSAEEDLASHLAATRLGAISVVPRSSEPKAVSSRVLLSVLASGQISGDELGETSMSELSDLLLKELRAELDSISGIVGDVVVPVGDELGRTLRDTSRKLRDGVQRALGAGSGDSETSSAELDDEAAALLAGRRAVVMEADRLRRAELARVLGEMGLEVLPPMPDLTKALEAGLAWAPDVFIGGAPRRDAMSCVEILKRDIALSSMSGVIIRWPASDRQWPDAHADVAALRPALAQQLVEAFAPQAELGHQLEGEGEVTGRIESCGMLALLQLVQKHRSRALLETAEGTDQFKAMIAGGQILDVIWIEGDGTMTAHFDAFARMLASTSGRFFVRPLDEDLPNLNLPGTLQELLTAACHWWRPMGLKIDQRLHQIGAVELDRRRATEFKRQAGKVVRKVVSALSKGKTPREIMDEQGLSAAVVAHALRELVRRFAVKDLPTST